MSRTVASRQYGKKSTRTRAERMFSELLQSPVRKPNKKPLEEAINSVTEELSFMSIGSDGKPTRKSSRKTRKVKDADLERDVEFTKAASESTKVQDEDKAKTSNSSKEAGEVKHTQQTLQDSPIPLDGQSLRILTWDDVCPPGDQILKIAEASYAEVYRITNERGTSIIKVIRLDSPIRPQTKTQIQARLVDEEPRSEADIQGELQISEWLADIPGFVVYKERYIVQGKATKGLLETHQKFQRRMKKQDPGRAQFYPSPSRYLDNTKFLVIELGDAGMALEDWDLETESQLWDIFFLEAIALARAEDMAMFEVCCLDTMVLHH